MGGEKRVELRRDTRPITSVIRDLRNHIQVQKEKENFVMMES